jgi:hypothetical protein
VKKATLHIITSLAILGLLAGCVSFPDDDSEPQEMHYSGVSLVVDESLDNEPIPQSQRTFEAKAVQDLKKLTYQGKPLEVNNSGSPAVIISARVATILLERFPAPGLDQGRYRTTLSVTFTSNYKNEVFFEDSVSFSKIYSSTPQGAAKKGAEIAARHLVNKFINDNELFYKYIPISKFPKKKSGGSS